MKKRPADPKPPAHLSEEASRFFSDVVAAYALEAHDLKLLTAAAECWDRLQEARRQIAKDGAFYVDRHGAPKTHPAVSLEVACRVGFARLLRELALPLDGGDDVRPPRVGQRKGGA